MFVVAGSGYGGRPSAVAVLLLILGLRAAVCLGQRQYYDESATTSGSQEYYNNDYEAAAGDPEGQEGTREGQFFFGTPFTPPLSPLGLFGYRPPQLNPIPYASHYLRNAFMPSPSQQFVDPYFYNRPYSQPYFPRYRRSITSEATTLGSEAAVGAAAAAPYKVVKDTNDEDENIRLDREMALRELAKYAAAVNKDTTHLKSEEEDDDDEDDDDDDDDYHYEQIRQNREKAFRELVKFATNSINAETKDDDDDDDDVDLLRQLEQERAFQELVKYAAKSAAEKPGTEVEDGDHSQVQERALQRLIKYSTSAAAAAAAKQEEGLPVPSDELQGQPQLQPLEGKRYRRFVNPLTLLGGVKLAEMVSGGFGGGAGSSFISSPTDFGFGYASKLGANNGYFFNENSASLYPADYGQTSFNEMSPGITPAADYGQSYFDEMSPGITPALPPYTPGGAY